MNVNLPGLLYDPSRHGKPRWYVRVRGRRARLQDVDCPPPFPGTRAALAAYHAAKAALDGTRQRAGQGTFRWLVEEYERSPTFRRLNDLTQRERRSVLGRIVHGVEGKDGAPGLPAHGHKPYALICRAAVVKLRDEMDREPANKRVKCLRYLFKWAIENSHATENPAADVELITTGSGGYTPWTRDDVLAFEARHPIGTKARLALALHLYTGQRRSDVAQWGAVNRRGDRLVYVQHKGRGRKPKRRDIPLVTPLRAILDASPLGATTWLETEHGKPFSIAGYGNWFRDRCDEAGLTGLNSHGIRKLVGIMAAERGATAHEIMQILGHDTLDEAERYTREADAIRLGNAGFGKVWGTEQG